MSIKEPFQCSGQIELPVKMANGVNGQIQTHKVRFLLIDNLCTDILIGVKTMRDFGITINNLPTEKVSEKLYLNHFKIDTPLTFVGEKLGENQKIKINSKVKNLDKNGTTKVGTGHLVFNYMKPDRQTDWDYSAEDDHEFVTLFEFEIPEEMINKFYEAQGGETSSTEENLDATEFKIPTSPKNRFKNQQGDSLRTEESHGEEKLYLKAFRKALEQLKKKKKPASKTGNEDEFLPGFDSDEEFIDENEYSDVDDVEPEEFKISYMDLGLDYLVNREAMNFNENLVNPDVTVNLNNTKIQELIHVNSKSLKKPIPNVQFKIQLQKGMKMKWVSQYRLPDFYMEKLQEQVDKWLENKQIIEAEDTNLYNNPLWVVPKILPDGQVERNKVRVCIDCRYLNSISDLNDEFQLPNVQETLMNLARAKPYLISELDLSSAFMQVMCEEETSRMLSFTFRNKRFQFTRAPFGPKQMPSLFQRIMSNLFKSLDFVVVYIDNIIVFSPDEETHISHLEKVIEILNKNNITLNPEKCKFFKRSIKLLGMKIGDGKIEIANDKVSKLEDMKDSINSPKQLRRIMGLLNFLRDFIPLYSKKAFHLEKLKTCKSSTKFKELFTEQRQKELNDMITLVKQAPPLYAFDPTLPLCLATDASFMGFGYTLYQTDENTKTKKILKFGSRSIRGSEPHYNVTKLELTGIVFALNKTRNILFGRKFNLLCDNKALTILLTTVQNSSIINTYWDVISEFDFTPIHLPGLENVLPDLLSRTTDIVQFNNLEDIEPELIDYIQLCHNRCGHQGINKTYQIFCRSFQGEERHKDWSLLKVSTIKDYIQRVINTCNTCIHMNRRNIQFKYPMKSITAKDPMEKVCIDLYSFKKDDNFQRILIATDVLTKFTFLRPIKDKTGTEVAKALENIFETFGYPKIIIHDRGKEFLNQIVEAMNKEYGIERIASTRYNPVGLIERYVQSSKELTKKMVFETSKDFEFENLPLFLPLISHILNNRVIGSTTPFQLMFGREYSYPIDKDSTLFKTDIKSALISINELSKRWINVKSNLYNQIIQRTSEVNQKRSKRERDQNQAVIDPSLSLKPNTTVYIKKKGASLKLRDSLEEIFEGPYKIINRDKKTDLYKCEDEYGNIVKTHLKNLKLVDHNHLKIIDKRQGGYLKLSDGSYSNEEFWIQDN